MKYKIILTTLFQKEAKRLLKKYPNIKSDFIRLRDELRVNPTLGEPLGNDIYKIRMIISDKRRGQSGGARVITYVRIVENIVYVLSVYDKSEYDSIVLKELLKQFEKLLKK